MRARHIAAVALVLGLAVTAFIVARALTQRDARRDSERRVEVAAAQIRDRIEQATSLTGSLHSYMLDAGGTGVTSGQFTRNASRWLSPGGFPAAAWAEEVQAAGRTEYERRTGRPIVIPDEPNRRASPSSSYLPATLVSGFPPLDLRSVDLRREPGIAAALVRATRPGGVAATPIGGGRARASGLFLVAAAPNLSDGVLRPGAVVVFMPQATLLASAGAPPGLRLVSAGGSSGAAGGNTVRKGFFVAGRAFAAVMPKESVSGPAATLPWIILAAGLVLGALATGLGVNAGRRARAQAEVDRIFDLSSDLITVADFEGHFTRVNPAVEQILGYTRDEFLARPYLDLVHPDDRETTAAEAAEIARGNQALSFENRLRHKDGSYRVLEWTATPVLEDGLMYGVARDVTARRQAEAARERLAEEQAALHRVAELVAQGASPDMVLDAVAAEMERLLAADGVAVGRYESAEEVTVVAHRSPEPQPRLVGTRMNYEGHNISALVRRTGKPIRLEDLSKARGGFVDVFRGLGSRALVGTPIVVEGRLWGTIVASWNGEAPPPADTEERMARFAELLETAIANADTRNQLTASRARLVTAGDEARRRLVRDLHDGAQQRLVHTIVTLKLAQRAFDDGDEDGKAESLVGEALEQAGRSNAELRELAHGILPSVLTRGGLRAGVDTVAERIDLPVDVEIPNGRFPPEVEASAYFVIAEALTNVMKHSHAKAAKVRVAVDDANLSIEVRDDGTGGADPGGHGLVGVRDRVTALGGQLEIESPADGGTVVSATLPLSAH
ncbi:MAG TPA: PAS domain S-box protein [Thermoleophilaceae bacterium]